jgi:predicted negative regulator of RcsB-dependent stress response
MQYARQINYEVWEPAVNVTLAWIKESCLVLSLVLVIVIARNVAWSRYAEHQSEQYAAGSYTQPVYNY